MLLISFRYPWTIFCSFAFFCWNHYHARAFVPDFRTHNKNGAVKEKHGLWMTTPEKETVVVVESWEAGMAATLALNARDILLNIPESSSSNSVMVPMENEAMEDYHQRVSLLSQDPKQSVVYHHIPPLIVGDTDNNDSYLKVVEDLIKKNPDIVLGIYPDLSSSYNNEDGLSIGDADLWNQYLQKIEDTFELNRGAVVVSWDLALHLCLLRHNSLPKVTTEFAIRKNDYQSFWIKYLYDYENYMGGSDPLVCETEEFSMTSSLLAEGRSDPSFIWSTSIGGLAFGAAYTALRGTSICKTSKLSPSKSAIIATGVGIVLNQHQTQNYNADQILSEVVKQCQDIGESCIQEKLIIMKEYTEFGYR